MEVFVFGLGYSSRATGRWIHRLVAPEIAISGTMRDPRASQPPRAKALAAHAFDGKAPSPTARAAIRSATHLLQSIPPQGARDVVLIHHRGDLDAAAGLEWIGYFSTIGVYGNADGAWIDETAPTHATNSRSRQRIIAETEWRAYADARGVPLAVLRLAGIYGPGRSAVDKLRSGTARRIVKPGQVFNRIHVEDIGRIAALAAINRLSGIFNVCDDEPAPPQDVVAHAAALLGIEAPPESPFDQTGMTEMARSFYADNKRCSNAAIKAALGVELLYPTYREGLAAIVRQGG